MKVLLVNGPNLNLLGMRDVATYGPATLAEVESMCRDWGRAVGLEIDAYQSNHEGDIIDRLHEGIGVYGGIVINPGALAHYSYAIHDAIEALGIPAIEVHISDIGSREEWRSRSVVSPACRATITGQGPDGYRQAIELLAEL